MPTTLPERKNKSALQMWLGQSPDRFWPFAIKTALSFYSLVLLGLLYHNREYLQYRGLYEVILFRAACYFAPIMLVLFVIRTMALKDTMDFERAMIYRGEIKREVVLWICGLMVLFHFY